MFNVYFVTEGNQCIDIHITLLLPYTFDSSYNTSIVFQITIISIVFQ